MFKKTALLFAAMMAFMFSAFPAFAAPVDLTALSASVDFSTAIVAILAACGALMGVYIAWKAASMVIAAVRRG